MKKVTILCLAGRKDSTAAALQGLGVLHVVNLQIPTGEQLELARQKLHQAQRALDILTPDHDDSWGAPEPELETRTTSKIIDQVNELAERRDTVQDRFREVQAEIQRVEPFGDFDPEVIKQLQQKNIQVHLYKTSVKNPPVAPEGTVLKIINQDKVSIYFALVGPDDAFGKELPYDSFRIPTFSLAHLRQMAEEQQNELDEINQDILQLGLWYNKIQETVIRYENVVSLLAVRQGMGGTDHISALQGFCPEGRVEILMEAAEQNGWGILVEDPAPEDRVPTQVYYPKLIRPIKAVFNMLQILPGYHESDISGVFLIFFSLFFGMLIGDAGYGLLFLVITLIARIKLPKAPSYPFVLMIILSMATIVWGTITGNFFGITNLPAPFQGIQVGWLKNQNNLMKLCFVIGAVHLTIAHVWNALELFPNTKAFAQLGWVSMTWAMFFTARTMVLQQPFPPWAFVLLGIGFFLIIVFMTPVRELKQAWINHAMLPLNVISNFVDIISYIRLFAVGMATLSVAQSFNNMALAAGFNTVWTGLIAAFILILGHGLNILLCGLGVLVHGVRLNTLEFSLHKEMQWSGFPYKPFARRTK